MWKKCDFKHNKSWEYLGVLVLVAGAAVKKNHPAVANGLTSMLSTPDFKGYPVASCSALGLGKENWGVWRATIRVDWASSMRQGHYTAFLKWSGASSTGDRPPPPDMDAPGDKRKRHQEDIRKCQQGGGDKYNSETASGNIPQLWAAGKWLRPGLVRSVTNIYAHRLSQTWMWRLICQLLDVW